MGMTINSMASNQLQSAMTRISAGQRINSAADDAAGLAIAEKLQAEINGLNKGTENTYNMNDLIKTAEGGLSGIEDGLQRVRELSIQAANGTLTDDDKAIIQEEVSQILKGITDTVNYTQYNNKNLLDGSFQNANTASSADGTGKQISIASMSLEELGLEGYDVTGDFDISVLDSAISAVSSQRSQLGAISNAFEHTIASNEIAALNQAVARSSIYDADIAKESMELSKSRVLQQYQMTMQKNQQQSMMSKVHAVM